MPSTAQGGSSGRPEWRQRLMDQIGEDPARWLDKDLLEPQGTRTKIVDRGHYQEVRLTADTDVSPPGETVKALISGMDSLERIRVWKAVERRLGLGPDGGPREFVMDLLDERESVLEETGERPERLSHGPRQSIEEFEDGSGDLTAAEVRADQADPLTSSASTSGSTSSTSSADASEASSLDQFAMTDGGVDGGE